MSSYMGNVLAIWSCPECGFEEYTMMVFFQCPECGSDYIEEIDDPDSDSA